MNLVNGNCVEACQIHTHLFIIYVSVSVSVFVLTTGVGLLTSGKLTIYHKKPIKLVPVLKRKERQGTINLRKTVQSNTPAWPEHKCPKREDRRKYRHRTLYCI